MDGARRKGSDTQSRPLSSNARSSRRNTAGRTDEKPGELQKAGRI